MPRRRAAALPHVNVFFTAFVDSLLLFSDVVDSRFTEQVDIFLESLTPLLKN
jgi:hypothetical protein